MLSSDEKKFLVKRAEEYYDKKKGDTDTQIRRFSSIAQQSDCYEEFMNFLKYQIGRAKDTTRDFRKGLMKEMEIIEEKVGYEKSLEAIANYFGYMARYAKYKK